MIDLDLQTVTKNLYDKLYTGYYEFSKCKIKEDEDIVDYWKKNLKKEEYTKYKGIESYIIGNISHIQKEYQKAVEYFMLAISIDSQIAYPVNSLGIVYKELKDNDKAIFYYKKAIALDDNYVAPYNNLGVVYNELKDYDKANFYLKKAIALDDKYLTTYINLGIVSNKLKDYDKAIFYYNKAIEINDSVSFFYSNLALVYETIGDLNHAEANLKTYVEKEADKLEALRSLMRFYIRNNITDDAYTLEYKKSIGKKRKTLDKYLLNKLDRKETSEDRVVNEKFSIEKKIEETDKELLNGFIIFIDLCNSTSFKQLMQEEWFDRLIHFYKSSEEYLRDILKEFEKNVYFLKYIGDEVMFFIEDKSLKNNSKFLKAILTYLKSVRDNMNTVYFINKNEERSVIAYEKNEKKIDIKTCITYVEKVKKYKINDSQFDILGTPVDFSARLMSLCKENIIVCNHDFVELLSDSNHSKDFKNLGKFNLHGFDENYEKNQDVYIYDYNNVMSIIDNKYLDDNSEIKKDLIGRLFLKVHNIK